MSWRRRRPLGVLHAPLATTEFLVVDTETNGLGGDACELTEVGAVLVGGGELHDRWETLVRTERPLSRMIQRYTGITQDMVDAAPPAEAGLPDLAELLEGRVLVAHSAAFDRRVLQQAFVRADLDWPDPPVLCTVALARRCAPLVRQRKLVLLAASLGIEVEVAHRALADAETCARVFCALFPRLCASAPTLGDALELLAPRRPARRRATATDGAQLRPGSRRRLPDLADVHDSPGVYVVRNEAGQVLYVGKSVRVRTRVRAHFAPSSRPAAWTARAETVEHHRTVSDLGALVLEQRLVRELRPPGNTRMKPVDDWLWLRCRLDIAFPVLELGREPAPAPAVNVGPIRGRTIASELLEQLVSLFGLRACGRRLPRRSHASAYGEMGRCLSPCLGDLDPNLYRRRVDAALAVLTRPGGGAALLAHVDELVSAASADRRYERAAWLRRRRARIEVLLERAGQGLVAVESGARMLLADAPDGSAHELFWVAGGRVADWGPLPALDELLDRTGAALRRRDEPLRADEIAEARTVGTWAAANEPYALDIDGGVTREQVARWLDHSGAGAGAGAVAPLAA